MAVLEEAAPGRRVLDVGRGAGVRAIPLDRAGFEVVGLDPSEGAPAVLVDAALYLDRLERESEAAERRVLRRLRLRLVEGGILVAPAELRTLVRESGFRVERELADSGGLLVARALVTPPAALAVASWRTPPGVGLDLRYAPDEAELLEPQPARIWESLVASLPRGGADVVGGYAVDDPYGGERGAAAVGRHFGCAAAPGQVTFAAGVTSLLHDLCGLADGGAVLAPELVHSDLEAWAALRGSELRLLPEPATAEALVAALRAAAPPALLHLDRPTFAGGLLDLEELRTVVEAAAEVSAPVVVDESAAPYLGGSGSAATLVPATENLVVLRGFTKAYSLGGLRAGFAFASEALAPRVRELVAPLGVGELALQAALRLLAAGDVFAALRAHVRSRKPEVVRALEAAGLEVLPGFPVLPWVAVPDPEGTASRRLERCGIQALRPAPPPGAPATASEILRLTIPLSDERWTLFQRLLGL